jgi:ABC-type cobalamin/Fe3+-siderophores transport system ATPase subunit
MADLTEDSMAALLSETLTTQNLTVGIGGHEVAKCDDLSLGPGKVLVLIGKNGSGKSTFLRTIGGFLKPISGEVAFYGKRQSEIQVEKIAAWLSQEEHLEFSWSVGEYVALGRIAHNAGLLLTKADNSAVEQALSETDAEKLIGRSMNELSGGERQRVRLARALAQETPIILMDEPTTHLDIDHQIQILWLVDKLAKQGKSIIVSLHDVVQAKQIGTQFLMFRDKLAQKADSLDMKMLEQTLGVQFEHLENSSQTGQIFPIYRRRTTD